MQEKPENSKKVMGIEGLSAYLDISKSSLYKLAQDGKLPGQKIGKHWRFRKETIDKWLDDGTEEGRKEKNEGGQTP